MGDRAQVHVVGNWNTDVWLYTHWGARALPTDVKEVIARGERLSQAEYLARMIFCSMVNGDEDGATGYGIGSAKHGDVYRVATVDTDEQELTLEGWDEEPTSHTFEEVLSGED